MEQKIQQLTEKIYLEGVEKGEKKAEEIIKAAEQKRAEIITEAQKQAKQVTDDAARKAGELYKNTESEIKLAAQQAVDTLKQKVIDLIAAQTIEENVAKSLGNAQVIVELVKTFFQNWRASSMQSASLDVLLPQNKQVELEKAFKTSAAAELSKGLSIQFTKSVTGGFQIKPSNAGYKISFTDEDFMEFFKEFLRPRSRKYLFGE
jgi:V/A-type H+/Na+-transporting ATPase subunit E